MTKMTTLAEWRQAQKEPATGEAISMTAAAALVGVSKSTWSRWERGLEPVGVFAVPRIVAATGIPSHELRPDVFTEPPRKADAA